MKSLCFIGYPKCAHWRFRSDCANAQADLNLRWAHMSKVPFRILRFKYPQANKCVSFQIIWCDLDAPRTINMALSRHWVAPFGTLDFYWRGGSRVNFTWQPNLYLLFSSPTWLYQNQCWPSRRTRKRNGPYDYPFHCFCRSPAPYCSEDIRMKVVSTR